MPNDLFEPSALSLPAKSALDFEQLGGIENTMTLIIATFEALSRNMMSGDLVVLSLLHAGDIARKRGVPTEIIDKYLDQMEAAMKAGRNRNPLSQMMPE